MRKIIMAFTTVAFLWGCSHGQPSLLALPTSQSEHQALGVSPNLLLSNNFIALYQVAGFSDPTSITAGADHNQWFNESFMPVISRVTSNGTITHFNIPSGNNAAFITKGKGNNLWFSEGTNLIGRINTTGSIKEFSLPGSDCSTGGVALGADGNMWFADRCTTSIGRITPTGVVVEYRITSSEPDTLVLGPNGNIWFTDSFSQFVGQITPAGTVTEYRTPNGDTPYDITNGPDGNLYVATSHGSDEILSVTTAGTMTGFSDAQGTGALALMLGPDKKVWLVDGGALLEFDPVSHTFSPKVNPPQNVGASALTLGGDGDVWFTAASQDFSKFYVGVYEEKVTSVGIRLNGEISIVDPKYGFELGYAVGTGTMTQTISLAMGESVQFQNLDTIPHSAAFVGNANVNNAPWPASFNGSTTQSPAGTAIGTSGWATGSLNGSQKSPIYETGLPGFYMIGCQYHYNTNEMRTVVVVH